MESRLGLAGPHHPLAPPGDRDLSLVDHVMEMSEVTPAAIMAAILYKMADKVPRDEPCGTRPATPGCM